MSKLPTQLERWVESRIGHPRVSMDQLKAYQLDCLNQMLLHARENSPFYRRLLKSASDLPLTGLAQTALLPITSDEDLRRYHLDMLCVSHTEVKRVVSLRTSGTSSAPKRIYFSEADLELNIDFFHYGLNCLVAPGQKVLILLPGMTPYSAGDQLLRAIPRIPAIGYLHWPVLDLNAILEKIQDLGIDCLLGAPAQVFALCRHSRYGGRRQLPKSLKTVLLTTDYVPQTVVDEITDVWDCTVFEHYGMTEMGYGGALQCEAHHGYHIREADLFVEVIDPVSGQVLPPGTEGEVVFTTLTRRAMPLIRYRTGDRAAWIKAPCPCGSVLGRLGKIRGRLTDISTVSGAICMPVLDEAILALDGIYSFQAALTAGENGIVLDLYLFCWMQRADQIKKEVTEAVTSLLESYPAPIPSIRVHYRPPEALQWDSTGMIKRTIVRKDKYN